MYGAVQELLNSIRSSAMTPQGNRQLLDVADHLESLFSKQEKSLSQTHSMLGRTQQELSQEKIEKAQIKEDLRILHLKNQALEELIRLKNAQHFGKSSERWTVDDENQALLFNELELHLAPSEPEAEPNNKQKKSKNQTPAKPKGKRECLPENLPREETVLDLNPVEKTCMACGKEMVKVGQDVSEQLQVRPLQWYVERTIRPSYGCSCGCGGVVAAPVPDQVNPKGIMGESTVAMVLTNKFCDALPFYRQERILARSGIEISRQTMARSAQAVALWLLPMLQLLDKRLANCHVLCADETRLRVLKENGIKKDSNSYMWVLSGTDEIGTMVKFHYGGGRGAKIARDLLTNFSGILMCDAYGAYPSAVEGLAIKLAACMAHVRRKFHDILKADSKNLHAQMAIELIAALYRIESEARHLSEGERLDLRQEKAVPAFKTFREWLFARASDTAPQSSLGKAVSYTINLFERLEVYLGDGGVPIDNNAAENAIRPFVVGRNNRDCQG